MVLRMNPITGEMGEECYCRMDSIPLVEAVDDNEQLVPHELTQDVHPVHVETQP